MSETSVRLAAVAIGRNEGDRLIRCLRSLRDQAVPVVYVDSASTDASIDNAKSLGAEVLSLDMARPFTAGRARAEGLERLLTLYPACDYALFVDGDCEVESRWPETAVQFLDTHPEYAVVCGRRRERELAASLYNRLADKEWDTPIGPAEACGGDSVMRLTAYQAIGGFNAALIAGEEPELCSRLRAAGWRIMRLDAPMTIHDAAMLRFGQWWQRGVRSGFGYMQVWFATRANASPGLYRREWQRALVWAGILPLGAIIAAMVKPWALLLWPAATAMQYARLAVRDGAAPAALSVVGKYAELLGMLRYLVRRLRGSAGGTISYK